MDINSSDDITHAKISWDTNGCPFSTEYEDIYFSKAGGSDESRYVFLSGNELERRFQTKGDFTIGETGFGTGLNFLLAWQSWQQIERQVNARLHFLTTEKFPLTRCDLTKALSVFPDLHKFSSALLKAYPPQPTPGFHRIKFHRGQVILTLFFGDASIGYEQLAPITRAGPYVKAVTCSLGSHSPTVDAWFLDGFAPAKNPEMWNDRLFRAIKNISSADASFATFTVAGTVRRSLTALGFVCQKKKGFADKREMLTGRLTPRNETTATVPTSVPNNFRHHKNLDISTETSWHLVENTSTKKVEHCVIIGGGLAGCHTALALAEKNILVTLVEKNQALAQEASGNRQGIVYAKLSPHQDPLSRFNLTAMIYASHIYHAYSFYQQCGSQCGALHFANNPQQVSLYKHLAKIYREEKQFVQWLSPHQCENISGVASTNPALYLPNIGWLSPPALCRVLLQHKNISVVYGKKTDHLQHKNGQWQILEDDEVITTADAVVIASAYDALNLTQCSHLPLRKIRGQITYLPTHTCSRPLQSILCGDGYITPSVEEQYSIGATFDLTCDSPETREEDHLKNIRRLKQLSSNFEYLSIDSQTLQGRVGFRCTTPDYMPIVGPLPDIQQMLQNFGGLRKKANAVIDAPGNYYPQLYCNLGHGSRGLCYTPLCAEILASIIAGHFAPVGRDHYRFLHPSRFIIRNLIRNKI